MKKNTIIVRLIMLLFSTVFFAKQVDFKDSNLPIILVNTEINPATNLPLNIADDPKVLANMKVIYRPDGSRNFVTDSNNADFLNYDGKIGIEFRGSSSQVLNKKPYGFETLENDGDTNNNVSLLGMPSENDWILNSLAFDPSMIRDYLSYSLAGNLGNYAPRVRYVELVVNNDYKGVYILTEKIKIDTDRVNIKKLSDSDNGTRSITGGYIIKADKTTGGNVVAWSMPNYSGWFTKFIHDSPNNEDITDEQSNYIEQVFYDLDDKTSTGNSSIVDGYPSIINLPSFIDYMIMAEISSNVDAYEFSTFFHKDKGGKLRAGPIWDYNLTFGNDLFIFNFDRSFYNVWQFEYQNTGAKFWKDLFENEIFKCYFRKRWLTLTAPNQILNYDVIAHKIDELINLLSEATIREQNRWGTVTEQANNIIAMKSWIRNRINWINSNIGSSTNCNNVSTPNLVISKIHYHPLEDGDYSSKDLEFIEITNNSGETINLTGIYISELGIAYQFPVDSSIAANEKIYLANDDEVFESYYGVAPFGEFHRSLSNDAYNLVLSDAYGNVIDEVHYSDENPWPKDADGLGAYLELKDVDSDNNLASNWFANPNTLSNEDITFVDEKIFVYPNPTAGLIQFKLNATSRDSVLTFIVYNSIGQTLGNFKIDNHNPKIDLSHLNNGLYFYVIKQGNKIIKKDKIIKN